MQGSIVELPLSSLNTIEKLATAISNDPNYFETIQTAINNKAPIATTYTKTEVIAARAPKADQINTYNKTEIKSNEGITFNVGSIIRMTVNLLEYTIEWMKDNKMMHRMNLDKSYVNQEMYPCLHLYYKDDSVSLLNN